MAFLLRNVRKEDFADLRRLGKELNTVNLPSSSRELRGMIGRSLASFAGEFVKRPERAQFLFVLEDLTRKRVVGTSKIFARHGTLARPHVYFQVLKEKVRSKSLGIDFLRTFYRLKQDKRGYTEIGGLVLDREYRSHPEQLGKQLSFIRFIFMKSHPGWFRSRVIAELLPPLHPGIPSSLYQFYGYPLTRLSYHQADRLSFHNKEFILKLFPKADLYHDILPPQVQADIGKTGAGSEVARSLLLKVGFVFANQVDPFDGGPYYIANKNRIKVYQQTRQLKFAGIHRGESKKIFQVFWENQGEFFGVVGGGWVNGRKYYFVKEETCFKFPEPGQSLWVYRWT
jgi:arginine N-succinyltransferase